MRHVDTSSPVFEYGPTGQWRLISLVPVAAIVLSGTIIFVLMADSKVWWWSFWMITPPTVVAALLAIGFSRMKVTMDVSGLRFNGLGYSVSAAWSNATLSSAPRLNAVLKDPDVSLSVWIAWMLPVAKVLFPWRARYARSSMRLVPLWYFDDGTLSEATNESRKAQSIPRV